MKFTIDINGKNEKSIQNIKNLITELGGSIVAEVEAGTSNRNVPAKYPFAILEINRYFKIPDDVSIQAMRTCASYWNEKYNGQRHFRVISKDRVVVRVK